MKINKESEYFKQGFAAFLTACCVIIFYFVLKNLNYFSSVLSKVNSVLMPFVWGFVIAYVLNSPYKRLNRLLSKKLKKASKGISILIVFFVFLLCIALFFYLLVPQIVNAVTGLIDTLPVYINRASIDAEKLISNYLERFDLSQKDINSAINYVTDNIFDNFKIQNIMQTVMNVLVQTTVGVKNFFMGLIVAIYFLFDKDHFILIGKKFVYVILGEERGKEALAFCEYTDRTFGQFILAKVVDSAIIGVICYIGMLILRLDYPLLIAIIVGVTNVIPFFGPFIGAVPSALLLFLVKPVECLIFVVFVIVLQQFDGNILGPKLIGNSTGIRAVFVIFAVVIGGGFFGVIGMFIGVPLFAIFYSVVSNFVNKTLDKKGISVK